MRLPARFALCLLAAAGCGGGNAASMLVAPPEFQPKNQARCGVEKSQSHPLIVEWPSSDRLELESKVRKGLVPVRYVGCEMTVLERCSVTAGKYVYVGGTRKQDELDINDEDDLYANLPVGAAALESKLRRSGKLTVKMDLVGRYEAERSSVQADELKGECQGATHFISGLTLGAFDFYSGGAAEVGASAGIAGIGAGAHSQSAREGISRDGDPASCEKANPDDKAPPAQCGALIRIEVVPLEGKAASTSPVCPQGSQWNGNECLSTRVVAEVRCPAGTRWDGTQCTSTSGAAAANAPAVVSTPRPSSPASVSSAPPAALGSTVRIPGGDFQMGANDLNGSTQPEHKVHVADFEMDATEVTAAQYAACTKAGACPAAPTTVDWPNVSDADRAFHSRFCNASRPDRKDHPINCVDWNMATAYCAWAGKRLPTEEEWEYAARGADGRKYPWGDDPPGPTLLNAGGDEVATTSKRAGQSATAMYAGNDGWESTAPVGSFPKGRSPFGLLDMAGNVWEWTASAYSSDYSQARSESARVYRGGSWLNVDPAFVRAAIRSRGMLTYRSNSLGFRCAK